MYPFQDLTWAAGWEICGGESKRDGINLAIGRHGFHAGYTVSEPQNPDATRKQPDARVYLLFGSVCMRRPEEASLQGQGHR